VRIGYLIFNIFVIRSGAYQLLNEVGQPAENPSGKKDKVAGTGNSGDG
jgi:hypothetical protein